MKGIHISLEELIQLRLKSRSLSFAAQKRVDTQLAGSHLSIRKGRGINFDEVRTYQSGDDIRNMDWQVTARTGKPHIKVYHEERERPVFLLIDYSPSMFFGTRVAFKSVIAAQVAALLGWRTVDNHDRLGAIIFSGENTWEFKPKTGKHGILPLLKKLSEIEKTPEKNNNKDGLFNALLHLQKLITPGSLIFILSDFYQLNHKAEMQLSRLSKHNEIKAFAIRDPLEKKAPPPNVYTVSNGYVNATLDLSNTAIQNSYQERFSAQHRYVNAVMKKHHIPLNELETPSPVFESLQQFFQTGEVIRE